MQSIVVSPQNQTFESFDSMLFTKGLERLLLCPESKEGAARIPDQTQVVPPSVFSHSTKVTSLTVGMGSAAFFSSDGVLYTLDKKTLVCAPAGIGDAVVIASETESIAAAAFAGCTLSSIVVVGNVRTIDKTICTDVMKASAVIALSGTEDFDARKVIWEQAGFTQFLEPAQPGQTFEPEPSASGFSYELLPDYTLSVSWQGSENPAADLFIPSTAELAGVVFRVSRIAENAFKGRGALESIEIPAAISEVGAHAFSGCTSLSRVTLGEGVIDLGNAAFEGSAIVEIVVPASVTSIQERTFADCVNLARIVSLSDGVSVAESALSGCSGVSILTPYREDADYTWDLGFIAMGNHLEPYGISFSHEQVELSVGEVADLFDEGVREVPAGCEIAYSYPATCISVDENGFASGKGAGATEVAVSLMLADRVLTAAVRSIAVKSAPDAGGNDGTAGYENEAQMLPFTSVALSLNQDGIMPLALTKFDYEWPVGSGKVVAYEILTIPVGGAPGTVRTAAGVDKQDCPNKNVAGDVVIPERVMFEGMEYTVTEIGFSSFGNVEPSRVNKVITAIEFPDTITDIKSRAFEYCAALEVFNLPKDLRSIGMAAFYGTSVASVNLPASVANLEQYAFGSCLNLENIEVDANHPNYCSINGVLYSRDMAEIHQYPAGKKEESYVIASSVTTVISYAFSSVCLNRVEIPTSVRTLAEYAFSESNQLLEIASYGDVTMRHGPLRATFNGCDRDQIKVFLPTGIVAGKTFDERKQVWLDDGFREANILEAPKKVVAFDSQGGSNVTAQTVVTGEPAIKPAYPTKDNEVVVGWYTEPECLTEWDFSTPVTESMTLYARWAASSGSLPVVDGVGSASWSITQDGMLSITASSDASIDVLWLLFDSPNVKTDYWGPVRDLVSGVVMDPGLKTSDMTYWFGGMTHLVNASDIFIPRGANRVNDMFNGCSNLKTVSPDLRIPSGVKSASGFFRACDSLETLPETFIIEETTELRMVLFFLDCTSLKSLPSTFVLPQENNESCYGFFQGCESLVALPEGFTIPRGTTDVSLMFSDCTALKDIPSGMMVPSGPTSTLSMFKNCTSLKGLPDGFTIADTVQDLDSMFQSAGIVSLPAGFNVPSIVTKTANMFDQCTFLTSLPAGFTIPNTVSDMSAMFKNCTSLTAFPAEFNIPLTVGGISSAFMCPTGSSVPTYYAGESEAIKTLDWGAQNRVLYTPENPLPADTHIVTFMLPDSLGGWQTYATSITDAERKAPDLGNPGRFGYPFEGWYADSTYSSQPFDFASTTLTADTTIYGKFGAPILRYEIPLEANISIDAQGAATADALKFRSYTPVEVEVKSVVGTYGPDAERVFPDSADRANIRARLEFEYSTITPPFSGVSVGLAQRIAPALGYATPGVLPCSLNLVLGDAKINYFAEETFDVARLQWTVGLA